MTRALAAIGRGEPALALKYHVFAPIVALAAVFTWAALGFGLVTARNFLPDLNGRRVSIACVVFIAAFLAYWLFRLWRGTAP